MFVVLLGCVAAWAELAPTQASQGSPQGQAAPPSQPTTDLGKKPSSDQPPAAPPEDSTQLVAIKAEKAIYPWEAQEKQLQGQVWVKIQVSETGNVESAEVISGDPVLAKAAVDAAKKWKFKPYIKNGKPVHVSTKLPFNFAFSENVHEQKPPPSKGDAIGDASAAPKRVRVSSGVESGLLIYKVQPVYPEEARRNHVQGVVILQATISTEGRITDLQLISGHPELVQAAVGAVQQWRYKPYLLMGKSVAVQTQIQVNFQLHY